MTIIIPEVQFGAGRQIEYILPASDVVTGLHLNFVTQPLCVFSQCLAKISVGLFLLRITPVTAYRRVIVATVVFSIFFGSWDHMYAHLAELKH